MRNNDEISCTAQNAHTKDKWEILSLSRPFIFSILLYESDSFFSELHFSSPTISDIWLWSAFSDCRCENPDRSGISVISLWEKFTLWREDELLLITELVTFATSISIHGLGHIHLQYAQEVSHIKYGISHWLMKHGFLPANLWEAWNPGDSVFRYVKHQALWETAWSSMVKGHLYCCTEVQSSEDAHTLSIYQCFVFQIPWTIKTWKYHFSTKYCETNLHHKRKRSFQSVGCKM